MDFIGYIVYAPILLKACDKRISVINEYYIVKYNRIIPELIYSAEIV